MGGSHDLDEGKFGLIKILFTLRYW